MPGVEQYNTLDPHGLYQYFRRVREWVDAHPDGPYVYSEWSQIPDDVEDYPRWCSYLALYRPMVTDQSVAHVEIRSSSEILSAIPDDVYITRFSNVDEYLVVSNVTGKPCRIELSGEWTDRRSGVRGRAFDVPENRMIFLKR